MGVSDEDAQWVSISSNGADLKALNFVSFWIRSNAIQSIARTEGAFLGEQGVSGEESDNERSGRFWFGDWSVGDQVVDTIEAVSAAEIDRERGEWSIGDESSKFGDVRRWHGVTAAGGSGGDVEGVADTATGLRIRVESERDDWVIEGKRHRPIGRDEAHVGAAVHRGVGVGVRKRQVAASNREIIECDGPAR